MADLILPLPLTGTSFGLLIPDKPDPKTIQVEDFVDPSAIRKALSKTGPIGSAPPAQWARQLAAKSFWPAYFNHTLPTCWPAAYAHWIQVLTWNNGKYAIPPEKYVLQAYYGAGGFNPATGQGTQGVYSLNMLNWLLNNPFGGDKHVIDGFASIDATNRDDDKLKWAIYSFGHVFAAVVLPQSAIDQYHAGDGHPFTIVDGPDGEPQWAHLLPFFGSSGSKLGTSTWGTSKDAMADWFWKYVREIWVVKSKEWKQLAGSGFDVKGFQTAVKKVRAA